MKNNKLIYTIPCSCWIPIVRYASTAKVILEKNPFLNEAFETFFTFDVITSY